MAHVTKYKMTFTDQVPIPSLWAVEFQYEGYTGDIIDLQPAASPLSFQRSQKGGDNAGKINPIIGSKAFVMTAIEDAAGGEAIRQDFYTSENFTIKALITQYDSLGAVIYTWTGFVSSEFCQYTLTPTYYEFTISCSDGIGLLDTIETDLLATSRTDTGYVEIIDILRSLGLWRALNGQVFTTNVISSLHRTGKTQTFDALSVFYSLWVDTDNGGFKDVKTVLTEIAASFDGRIFFDDGAFWFQRIADMSNPYLDSYLSYVLTSSPVAKDFTPVQVLGGDDSDLTYVQNYSTVEISAALKQYRNDIDYIFRNLFANYDWSKYSGGQFDDWDASDWSLISQGGTGTEEDPFYCQFNGTSATSATLSQWILFDYSDKITISFKLDLSNCDKTAWQLHAFYDTQDVTADHRVWLNGAWADSAPLDPPGSSDYNNFLGKPPASSGTAGVLDFSIEVPLPGFVSGGGGTFTGWYNNILFMFIDPDGGAMEMKIYDVHFSFIPDGRTGETLTAVSSKKWSDKKETSDITLIDGGAYLANRLYYDGDDQDANLWYADDFDQPQKSFQVGSILSIMGQNGYPYEKMQVTALGNTLRAYHVIKRDLDDKLFLQLGDTYDVKSGTHDLTLAEIRDITEIDDGLVVTKKYKPQGSGSPMRVFEQTPTT